MHPRPRAVDHFGVYCGTSTGSLIVPLAACGELPLLENQYTTLRQGDLVRFSTIGNLVTGISLHFDPAAMKGKLAKGFAQAKAYFEWLPPSALA